MLNLYHPLRAFEEICMLDHLSDDDRFRFFHPDRDRLRGWGGRIRTSDTLATAFAPCATSLSAFVRVRLYTLTSWPAFRRLAAMPVPICPNPMNPIFTTILLCCCALVFEAQPAPIRPSPTPIANTMPPPMMTCTMVLASLPPMKR